MTLVEKIKNWSKIFGAPIKKEKGFPSLSRQRLAIKLIEEEYKELYQAIAEENLVEVEDALGDLLWVTIRAMYEFGIDPEKTIEAIYESNMSKADKTEEEAADTYAMYMRNGIKTYTREIDGYFITLRVEDEKILKGINFKKPNFN